MTNMQKTMCLKMIVFSFWKFFEFGFRLQKTDIEASKLVKSDDVSHGSCLLLKAHEFFQIVSQPKRTANEIRVKYT